MCGVCETVEKNEKQYEFGFVCKENNRVIGSGGIGPAEDNTQWEIGYNLCSDCWNQGYSSEVLGEIVRLAREELPGITLVGHVVAENRGSRRVLEKNGFSHTETLHFPDMEGEGLCIYQLAL